MKIENAGSVPSLLHKGAVESSQKNIKQAEGERLKAALDSAKKPAIPVENRGFHIDTKA